MPVRLRFGEHVAIITARVNRFDMFNLNRFQWKRRDILPL